MSWSSKKKKTGHFWQGLFCPKEIFLTSVIYLSVYIVYRSRHQRCSARESVLRNFAKFKGKHLCQSLFLVKLPATFLDKETLAQVFPVNFAKFLRTCFLQNTSGRLLLIVLNTPSEYTYFYIAKNNISDTFCLFLKS